MASGNILVYGGDFVQNSRGQYRSSSAVLKLQASGKAFFRETIPVAHLTEIDIYTPASAGIGAVGGALAGEVLLGPIGAILGAVLATRKTNVTFTATFKDGRRLFGKTDSETFARLKGSVFDTAGKRKKAEAAEAANEAQSKDRVEALVRRYKRTQVPASIRREPESPSHDSPQLPLSASPSRSDAPSFGKRRS